MAEVTEHHDPFEPGHLFGHVQDSIEFEVPKFLAPPDGKVKLIQPFYAEQTGTKANSAFVPLQLKFTKFMAIELVVAVLMVVLFVRLANKMRKTDMPRGKGWNALEALLVFLRDEVARPAIGHHDADKFLPFIWTMFFFVLFCNLFGLIPWAGSPTGALATTGALAICTFVTVIGAGMAKLGPLGFWLAQIPHIDVPFPMGYFLKPMIFVIEIMGLFIRHFVLAVRLLANMMGGHLVLAVLLSFIVATAGRMIFWGVMPVSVLGATALSMLELFVGVLQAYIFTFLSALFIGMAIHPH
jgi:F-type H+-transporting ATPase subunit a